MNRAYVTVIALAPVTLQLATASDHFAISLDQKTHLLVTKAMHKEDLRETILVARRFFVQ